VANLPAANALGMAIVPFTDATAAITEISRLLSILLIVDD
jgi:hypothetical protein